MNNSLNKRISDAMGVGFPAQKPLTITPCEERKAIITQKFIEMREKNSTVHANRRKDLGR